MADLLETIRVLRMSLTPEGQQAMAAKEQATADRLYRRMREAPCDVELGRAAALAAAEAQAWLGAEETQP